MQDDAAAPIAPRRRQPEPAPLPKLVVMPAFGLAVALAVWRGAPLWDEWRALRHDWDRTRSTALVGYEDIHPVLEAAEPPGDWYREEGSAAALWTGWRPGEGHRWFRFRVGEIPRHRLKGPLGRDALRAIDRPVVERDGGGHWSRIAPDALVASLDVTGTPSIYPLLLMSNVEVVNDEANGRPYLVVYSPADDPRRPIEVFTPLLDGRRVTLGHSGYFLDKQPLLYDRGTESLWTPRQEGLVAIAGPLKGRIFPRIARPALVAWSDWKDSHTHGRLIAGADRSRGTPLH
ncbi:MAG TPA: DUF3179 domain-containing (seleno)protein [Isosphaeraceae bacterium]|jgi:hypothetical protein|nr:DUF3179 domain-containing (seleno)protein [Isosphaeraceae bacterium]